MEYKRHTFEDVINEAKQYLNNEKNLELIEKAYRFAFEKHQGQFRKSGDPYIQHPIEVAYMLVSLRVSPTAVAAGFLHDILEDTDITKEELTGIFGNDIANIVDSLTKISQLKYMTKEKALARSHQKILMAMAKDIRVILVKLIDRMHNMRTLEFQEEEKRVRIARETLDLYAPLAHRMGMYRIKAELEDISLKYIDPETYTEIADAIIIQKQIRDDDMEKMRLEINEVLDNNRIPNYEVKGRIKNIFSICKKMEQKQLEFDQIYDLMAIRIIVPTIEDCYHVLGLIHGHWTPIPKRFKDYIAMPKPNLYQSLHTTIVGMNGKIYEVQIRTYQMDEVAELGIAAHWAYKEDNKEYSQEKAQNEITVKMKWYRDLLAYAEIGEEEDNDPLKTIKDDIFSANVYVFTPTGDVMDFPTGATPLDFAYKIHTEVGNRTIGALVNNKIVPLTYKLKTGDIVEIKTSKNISGPHDAWLKIVKTSHAKHKIISILNKQKREQLIVRGKEEFDKVLKADNVTIKLDDKIVSENFSKYGINTVDDFYCEISKGVLAPRGAINRIIGISEKLDDEALIKHYNENSAKRRLRTVNDYGIIIDGLDRAQIKLASCCHPVRGDSIVGYVSKGYGIVVHRFECHNTKNTTHERYIDVLWDYEFTTRTYDTVIVIASFDRKNIVADMINTLNSTSVTITSISSGVNKDGDLITKIKLAVNDIDALTNAITNLNKVPDLYSIERLIR